MATQEQIKFWLEKLGYLKTANKGSIAPHQPLLLLSVFEMAEQGRLTEPLLKLSAELAFRFSTYWQVVVLRRGTKPEVRMPFFHIKTSGVWLPLDSRGEPATSKHVVTDALLNEGFFACVLDQAFRGLARRKLIARYFTDPNERHSLYSMLGIAPPPDDIARADAQLFEQTEAKRRGREGRFRNSVVPAYNLTCALTGYRVNTLDESIVDAAHIHQFAKSGNNDPRNGMALSKNAHWLFDRGLWSLTDDYRVIVSKADFEESGPENFLLRGLVNKRIHLPSNREYWPDLHHLDWHREHKLRK